MKNGFKVMDSDMHIIEPPDLWQRYIDPAFRDQAPRGSTERVADLGLVGPDGKPWGRNPKNVTPFRQDRRGTSFQRNQERFKPYEEMGWTGASGLGAGHPSLPLQWHPPNVEAMPASIMVLATSGASV